MLIAKLKKPIDFIIHISPTKTENRVADCFHVIPTNYLVGGKTTSFQVHFTKSKIVPLNPSSNLEGEGETTIEYETQKIFSAILEQEEMATWGENDESLLQIIAQKYGIEIDSFINNNI